MKLYSTKCANVHKHRATGQGRAPVSLKLHTGISVYLGLELSQRKIKYAQPLPNGQCQVGPELHLVHTLKITGVGHTQCDCPSSGLDNIPVLSNTDNTSFPDLRGAEHLGRDTGAQPEQ